MSITVDIPQISLEEDRGSMISKRYLHNLPTSYFYGSMFNKHFEFAVRHEYMNKLIQEVYIEHGIGKNIREKDEMYSLDADHFRYKCNIETIVYWMRKSGDDIISLLFYLDYWQTNNSEPPEIEIDAIAKLINGEASFKSVLQERLPFLHALNEVSNCYKHSFVNTEVNHLIGKEEPTVVALFMKRNKLKNSPQYHSYSLRWMVTEYSIFYTTCRKIMAEFRHSE